MSPHSNGANVELLLDGDRCDDHPYKNRRTNSPYYMRPGPSGSASGPLHGGSSASTNQPCKSNSYSHGDVAPAPSGPTAFEFSTKRPLVPRCTDVLCYTEDRRSFNRATENAMIERLQVYRLVLAGGETFRLATHFGLSKPRG